MSQRERSDSKRQTAGFVRGKEMNMQSEALDVIKWIAGVPSIDTLAERLLDSIPDSGSRSKHSASCYHELLLAPVNRDGVLVVAGMDGRVVCEIRESDPEDVLAAVRNIARRLRGCAPKWVIVNESGRELMRALGVEDLISGDRVPVVCLYDSLAITVMCVVDRREWEDAAVFATAVRCERMFDWDDD